MAIHLSGAFYHLFLDPLLGDVRRTVSKQITPDARVLEIGSGSGQQALELASRGCRVLGVDLDGRMTAYAGSRIPAKLSKSLVFRKADGRVLDFVSNGEFDVALITLALHAMPPGDRLSVLAEAARIAPILLVSDYTIPVPRSFSGAVGLLMEHLAGGRHLAGFRDYRAHGGLSPLFEAAGLRCRKAFLPSMVWWKPGLSISTDRASAVTRRTPLRCLVSLPALPRYDP